MYLRGLVSHVIKQVQGLLRDIVPDFLVEKFSLRHLITIEPLFLCFALAHTLRVVVFQTLIYQKVCVTTYNRSVCHNLHDPIHAHREVHVQQMASIWEFYESLAFMLPSIPLNVVYGILSDRISRKVPMILGCFGATTYCSILLYLGLYLESSVAWIIPGAILYACCGGTIVILTCGLSYLSVVTADKSRTLRISVAEAMILLSGATANFYSGNLLKATSFAFVYSMCITLNVLSLLYVAVWLKDADVGIGEQWSSHRGSQKHNGPQYSGRTISLKPDITNCDVYEDGNNVQNCAKQRYKYSLIGAAQTKITTWDLGCFNEGVTVLLRKRSHGRRRYVLLQLAALAFYKIGGAPGWILAYLFLCHTPLSWTPAMYGHFEGLYSSVRCVYLLVALPLLKARLGIADTSLMLLGILSTMAALIVFGSSTHTDTVYLVLFIGFFTSGTVISLRGLISTMVESYELGKIFGLIASIESLSSLLASGLYSYILYPMTVVVWPGFCFYLGASILVVPVIITSYLHICLHTQAKAPVFKVHVSDDNLPDP